MKKYPCLKTVLFTKNNYIFKIDKNDLLILMTCNLKIINFAVYNKKLLL
jgi:hypothetical protein